MRRYELTDEQFALLEPYLPKMGPEVGHPWADHRPILNGLFWKLRSGAPWRDIPERYGPWEHDLRPLSNLVSGRSICLHTGGITCFP
jgi:transposase